MGDKLSIVGFSNGEFTACLQAKILELKSSEQVLNAKLVEVLTDIETKLRTAVGDVSRLFVSADMLSGGTPSGMAVKISSNSSFRLTTAPHTDLVNSADCFFPTDKHKMSFQNYITKIYSQDSNCGFQFILADGSETVAGSASDNMKCDVLPTERKVRKIITYQSNNREAMLVGIAMYDG